MRLLRSNSYSSLTGPPWVAASESSATWARSFPKSTPPEVLSFSPALETATALSPPRGRESRARAASSNSVRSPFCAAVLPTVAPLSLVAFLTLTVKDPPPPWALSLGGLLSCSLASSCLESVLAIWAYCLWLRLLSSFIRPEARGVTRDKAGGVLAETPRSPRENPENPRGHPP